MGYASLCIVGTLSKNLLYFFFFFFFKTFAVIVFVVIIELVSVLVHYIKQFTFDFHLH
jgi:hypothetical protein